MIEYMVRRAGQDADVEYWYRRAGIRRATIALHIGKTATDHAEKIDVMIQSEDPEAEPNWALLSQVAEMTGGAVNASLADVLKRAPAERQIGFPLVETLALAAFALVLADIALRLLVAGRYRI